MDQLVKQAHELLQMRKQALRLEHQSYMPQNKKRALTKEELAEIAAAKSQLIPKIFPSLKDSLPSRMHSSVLPASLGVLVGGLGGGFAGGAVGNYIGGHDGTLAGAGLGALLGGTAGGVIGHKATQSGNEDLEEQLTRLPRGATLRDYYADAFYQSQRQESQANSRAGLLASALMGQ